MNLEIYYCLIYVQLKQMESFQQFYGGISLLQVFIGTHKVMAFDSLKRSHSLSRQRVAQHIIDHVCAKIDILKRSLSTW